MPKNVQTVRCAVPRMPQNVQTGAVSTRTSGLSAHATANAIHSIALDPTSTTTEVGDWGVVQQPIVLCQLSHGATETKNVNLLILE